MKMSRRARRMERHHKRKRTAAAFSLVSLMDIFTILVFFLLVNSSEVEVLQGSKAIRLPESVAEQKPRETLVVMVGGEDILVQGRRVAGVPEALAGDGIIPALKAELDHQTERARRLGGEHPPGAQREITIMGDRSVPYRVLKRIMLTCARADYGNISLAVLNKGQGEG